MLCVRHRPRRTRQHLLPSTPLLPQPLSVTLWASLTRTNLTTSETKNNKHAYKTVRQRKSCEFTEGSGGCVSAGL